MAASIVEGGRIHLDLSLIFGVTSQPWDKDPATCKAYVNRLAELLPSMRIAGGTILHHAQAGHPCYRPSIFDLTGNEADRNDVFRKGRKCLLPGFALVSRPDLIGVRLIELKKINPQATRLDAWLSLCRVNWTYQFSDNNKKSGTWENDKKGKGHYTCCNDYLLPKDSDSFDYNDFD